MEENAELLHERGILYAPDSVVNAGGMLCITDELGLPMPRDPRVRMLHIKRRIGRLYDIMAKILRLADNNSITPEPAARRLAEEILAN